MHFVSKHSDLVNFQGLTQATKQYFMSHLEFGGCLADYPGLQRRYTKLRALEDTDDISQPNGPGHHSPKTRVRFLNYYTASTGIIRKPKIAPSQIMDEDGQLKPMELQMEDMSVQESRSRSPTPVLSIVVEEDVDEHVAQQKLKEASGASPIEVQMTQLGQNSGVKVDKDDEGDEEDIPPMKHIDSMPIADDEDIPTFVAEPSNTTEEQSKASIEQNSLSELPSEPQLPPIPSVPTEPQPIDLSIYTDKDSRKIAEKEQKRLMKVYQQAVKDRESAVKDRRKLVEKREKKARQEAEKQAKAEEKQRLAEEKEELKRQATINPAPKSSKEKRPADSGRPERPEKPEKPKRDKKFCMLPSGINGKPDVCWVRVYMEGVDEVGAHCGLFFPGPQYESLVGDVGARIQEWVKVDATRRAILEIQSLD